VWIRLYSRCTLLNIFFLQNQYWRFADADSTSILQCCRFSMSNETIPFVVRCGYERNKFVLLLIRSRNSSSRFIPSLNVRNDVFVPPSACKQILLHLMNVASETPPAALKSLAETRNSAFLLSAIWPGQLLGQTNLGDH